MIQKGLYCPPGVGRSVGGSESVACPVWRGERVSHCVSPREERLRSELLETSQVTSWTVYRFVTLHSGPTRERSNGLECLSVERVTVYIYRGRKGPTKFLSYHGSGLVRRVFNSDSPTYLLTQTHLDNRKCMHSFLFPDGNPRCTPVVSRGVFTGVPWSVQFRTVLDPYPFVFLLLYCDSVFVPL